MPCQGIISCMMCSLNECGSGISEAQRAVQEKGRYAVFPELVDLVLHQGDERRNYDCQAVEDQSGDLIAEGLAPARRHDDQGVLFLEDVANDLFLKRPECLEAEDFFDGGRLVTKMY